LPLLLWFEAPSYGTALKQKENSFSRETLLSKRVRKKRSSRRKSSRRKRRGRSESLRKKALKVDPQWLYPGVGVFFYSLNRYTQNLDGSDSGFGETAAEIALLTRFTLKDRLTILPSFRFTPLGRATGDEAAQVRVIRLDAPLGYTFSFLAPLEVCFGPGITFYQMTGSGGTVVLNNGNTTTEFGKPNESVAARNFVLQAGLSTKVWKRLRLELGLSIPGLTSSRRDYHLFSSLTYGVL